MVSTRASPRPGIDSALETRSPAPFTTRCAATSTDGPAARLTAAKPLFVYVINRGEQAEPQALAFARQLRGAGMAVELDGTSASFGKQFKRADRSGAQWAAVIGDEEAKTRQVRMKPLRGEGEECQFNWQDATTYLMEQR